MKRRRPQRPSAGEGHHGARLTDLKNSMSILGTVMSCKLVRTTWNDHAALPNIFAMDEDDHQPQQQPGRRFETSVNPYRGCEHGCIYCYARPTHEYLGFSAGLDFESKIMVKMDAPELLKVELESPRWKPQVLVMSGVTDPYQPIERKLGITRGCLEVLAQFRNPVAIITKNRLVTRDLDLLGELATYNAAAVNISVTSLDSKLQRVLEPRTSYLKRVSKRSANFALPVFQLRDGCADHPRTYRS